MARKGRNNILLIFSCIVILVESSYSLTDKLLQGQVLQSGKALVSASEKFRLGFFSAGNGFQYLGIWFNHRPGPNREYKPVWVANRNIPILDTDSVYLIVDSTDGNLKILRNGGNPIALSSVQGASNTSVSATLLQSGNFVLHELNSNGSIRRMLWQSFDYPTDTLLPGMKLGINFKTGHKWFLQSWITDESPAQGSFTLGMDPNFTNRLTVWWRGERVQDSRPWLNGRLISSPSEIYVNLYNFSYTSNEQEKYFSFSVNEDESSFQLVRIDSDARVNFGEGWNYIVPEWHYTELPMCVRSGYDDYEIKYGFMSEDGFKFKESDNMTEFDCRIKCLINCSCSAFATTDADNNTSCEIWSRGTKFTESHEDNDRLTYIKIEPNIEVEPKVAGQKKKRHPMIIIGIVIALLVLLMCCLGYGMRRKCKGKEEKWWISLIIVVGVALLIPLLGCLCYLMWGKLKAKVQNIMNRKKLLRELGDNVSLLTTHYRGKRLENDRNMRLELKIFDFQIIAAATNNFSVTNKLGEGGFGPVYKGQLLDGQEIAIKRLSRSSRQGIVEFKNEAKLIAKLQHTNLVRLLGCSLHGEERLLVYEYMPNKSLDFFIFNSERKNILNWKKRFSIIEGIAQGLLYLHKYSRLTVIHRDLKASNILLDDQMNPKISDFGMARIFGVNEAEANTKRVVGTYGYMSPEYAMSGIISMKTDVFSFGVLVLEIVSGKKNHGCYDPDRPLNLIGYAWQLLNEGKALELIDLSLKESCSANENEVLRCIHVGLLCVQDQAMDRPSILDVIFMLKNETMALPPPKQPAFFINVNTDDQDTEVPENKEENCSTNDVTTTTMEAR